MFHRVTAPQKSPDLGDKKSHRELWSAGTCRNCESNPNDALTSDDAENYVIANDGSRQHKAEVKKVISRLLVNDLVSPLEISALLRIPYFTIRELIDNDDSLKAIHERYKKFLPDILFDRIVSLTKKLSSMTRQESFIAQAQLNNYRWLLTSLKSDSNTVSVTIDDSNHIDALKVFWNSRNTGNIADSN